MEVFLSANIRHTIWRGKCGNFIMEGQWETRVLVHARTHLHTSRVSRPRAESYVIIETFVNRANLLKRSRLADKPETRSQEQAIGPEPITSHSVTGVEAVVRISVLEYLTATCARATQLTLGWVSRKRILGPVAELFTVTVGSRGFWTPINQRSLVDIKGHPIHLVRCSTSDRRFSRLELWTRAIVLHIHSCHLYSVILQRLEHNIQKLTLYCPNNLISAHKKWVF